MWCCLVAVHVKLTPIYLFFWGGGVLLSSSFMRVPLVCFDSSFFIVISTCVMLVQFVSSVFFLFFSFFVDTSIQHML